MSGRQPALGPDEEVGWLEVWGNWATVVREAVCAESHRKSFRGEIHPPCVQNQAQQCGHTNI